MNRLVLFSFICLSILQLPIAAQVKEDRIPWTTSKIVGSPEPPLPYTTEAIYTEIKFRRPIHAITEAGTTNIIVILQNEGGPAKGLLFEDEKDAKETTLFFEIPRLVYGITFHPKYKTNRKVYIFSNGDVGKQGRHNRVAEYTVRETESPRCDPKSERIILEWPSAGHDGGDLCFGNDGMLYLSSGDGSTDSDTLLTGQDLRDIRGGVLRIDVDSHSNDQPYSIPEDNPYHSFKEAKKELWAIGLRNPWRMSYDRESDQLWVGNNGQDLWETVHLVRKGENYGWSVYEGNHPFYLNRKLAPVPFTPPTAEHHHREARSLTGGVVYRGDRHPDLVGAYIYGDYSTGKIWGILHDGKKIIWKKELADTVLQIAGFSNSPRGELLIVDHGGGIHALRKREIQKKVNKFPRKLTETGLFKSVKKHQLEEGIISYSVAAEAWQNGAEVDRFIAVPGSQRLRFDRDRAFGFPEGSVILQTIRADQHRIETRLLVLQDKEWVGYSYAWNADQTDAHLVESEGKAIDIPHFGSWKIPSRAECMSCHSREARFVLGVTGRQLNIEVEGKNQLDTFHRLKILNRQPNKKFDALTNPYDKDKDLTKRARSYLHVNCSACHIRAGGGNSQMELRIERPLKKTNTVDIRPRHHFFDINNAMLIAPQQPDRSVLLKRLEVSGSGQMPPIGRHKVDKQAVDLFREWIQSLKRSREFVRKWKLEDFKSKLNSVRKGQVSEQGKNLFMEAGCQQCHSIGELKSEGVGPDLSSLRENNDAMGLLDSILNPSKNIAPEYRATEVITKNGMVVTGRIEHEDENKIIIRTPDAFKKPIEINKGDIVKRSLSDVSTMPSEILNEYTQDEILKLLSYLVSVQR